MRSISSYSSNFEGVHVKSSLRFVKSEVVVFIQYFKWAFENFELSKLELIE